MRSPKSFTDWCKRETKITYMESDVSTDMVNVYMEDGQVDCSAWEIQHPTEPGWCRFTTPRMHLGPAGNALIIPVCALAYMAWLIYTGPW